MGTICYLCVMSQTGQDLQITGPKISSSSTVDRSFHLLSLIKQLQCATGMNQNNMSESVKYNNTGKKFSSCRSQSKLPPQRMIDTEILLFITMHKLIFIFTMDQITTLSVECILLSTGSFFHLTTLLLWFTLRILIYSFTYILFLTFEQRAAVTRRKNFSSGINKVF